MQNVAKVAVSLPRRTLERLDRVAKGLQRTRSAAVTAAIEAWLRANEVTEENRRYAEAYLREPERLEEVAAVGAAAVAAWEPWEEEP